MHQTKMTGAPYEGCPDTKLPDGFIDAPARFVDTQNEMRLIQQLRDVASFRNPYQILAVAAAKFFEAQNPAAGAMPDQDEELANAFADLAVTGRRSYCLLATPPRTPLNDLQVSGAGEHIDLGTEPFTPDELVKEISNPPLAPGTSLATLLEPLARASAAEKEHAINTALDRAFTVAWALRGPLPERATARAKLGWIAVSGEDCMPHRPVNVPAPPFEQYEIPVKVPAAGGRSALTLQTRFIIASPPAIAPEPKPHTLRELPTDSTPDIPPEHHVLLFLHGHVSGAEEALTIIPYLNMISLTRGEKLSVISVDLPNGGYSESFDHRKIAPSSGTIWPATPTDHGPILTPVLDFIEDFVVAFVDALDMITPIKARLDGIFGGSLGGNLGLRLGRRSPTPPWLNAGIVSWSAASVWDAMVQDVIKGKAPHDCQVNWDESEFDDSRATYFQTVYDKIILDFFMPWTQPDTWYRPDWEPCKHLHIQASRQARREVYCANLRQWHWRVAGEQLIYSHVDRKVHGDNTTPWRYEENVVRQLLIAGQDDNYRGTNIFDATRTLADLMAATPGTSLFLAHTGHSVHFERPNYLAEQILDFLPTIPTPPLKPTQKLSLEIQCVFRERTLVTPRVHREGPPHLGKVLLVNGMDRTQNKPFSMTVPECVDFIDFGCDAFVLQPNGSQTKVIVVRKPGRMPYLATVPGNTTVDNLHSLPTC